MLAFYDLVCENCKHEFEDRVRYNEIKSIPCPNCKCVGTLGNKIHVSDVFNPENFGHKATYFKTTDSVKAECS